MTDDLQLDGRRWRFLDNPRRYLERASNGLHVKPLARQFKTAKAILERFMQGRGVLLADDVGLGKTTVGALVAWAFAIQGKRVRIYAPNEVLRRRWAEELERHVPMLEHLGASDDLIKQGDIGKLKAGRIQVATHHALVKSHGNNEQRTACDLMIIDEAHRAKGEDSAFKDALDNLGDHATRKLILTATPFSIHVKELTKLLRFIGASELDAVHRYSDDLLRLHSLGSGHDVALESERLIASARAAVDALQPFLIRHSIDDLSTSECKHFGAAQAPWEISTRPANDTELSLLLRMDRLLHLTAERKGDRKNDPRFHIGWQHLNHELEHARTRALDDVSWRHGKKASRVLAALRSKPHPKIAAVSEAIKPVVAAGEKVLIFCHHRATANEVLSVLERSLKQPVALQTVPPAKVWRSVWEELLPDDELVVPIIDWLCSSGLRAQISGWLGKPARTAASLKRQLLTTRPRHAKGNVPFIAQAACALVSSLLAHQSKSTRALLKSISKGTQTFGGKSSHFPGRLDAGFCAMGSWHHDGHGDAPSTLYTGKPDIVLALFNSPFGPDVLVTTDRLSEGVDLHRCCRHLIHYELDPSPVRTLQRNGRVRRVGSWAALTERSIEYAYPTFGGTRDEKAVGVMKQRIDAFGLLLGGVPSLAEETDEELNQSFAEDVLRRARERLASLNGRLCV